MDAKFSSLLSIVIIPRVVDLIMEKDNMDEKMAIECFYQSETYNLLSQEETKFWHYSPLALYHIWKEERETGIVDIPEGQ